MILKIGVPQKSELVKLLVVFIKTMYDSRLLKD